MEVQYPRILSLEFSVLAFSASGFVYRRVLQQKALAENLLTLMLPPFTGRSITSPTTSVGFEVCVLFFAACLTTCVELQYEFSLYYTAFHFISFYFAPAISSHKQ